MSPLVCTSIIGWLGALLHVILTQDASWKSLHYLGTSLISQSRGRKGQITHWLLKVLPRNCISHFISMSLVKVSHTHDNAILQGGREVYFYCLPRSNSTRNILPKIPMHYTMSYCWLLRSNSMGRNSVIFQDHWNANLPLSLKYLFYLFRDAWSSFNST